MCGRYFFDAETALEVEDELGLDSGLLSVSSGDITPAMSPAVITAGRGSDIPDGRRSWNSFGNIDRSCFYR